MGEKITVEALNRVENSFNNDLDIVFKKIDKIENELGKLNIAISAQLLANDSKEVLKLVIEQAEKARIDSKELLNSFMLAQNKQFKILITILAGISVVITAFLKIM
jgi:archaellum component FlaC